MLTQGGEILIGGCKGLVVSQRPVWPPEYGVIVEQREARTERPVVFANTKSAIKAKNSHRRPLEMQIEHGDEAVGKPRSAQWPTLCPCRVGVSTPESCHSVSDPLPAEINDARMRAPGLHASGSRPSWWHKSGWTSPGRRESKAHTPPMTAAVLYAVPEATAARGAV